MTISLQSPVFSPTTTTVQDIIDSTSQDVRDLLDSGSNPNQATLIDYCNRVHMYLLLTSRWKYLLSPVQRFATQLQQTDYWIGPSGQGPLNAVETNLNLNDLELMKEGSVFDRSNFRALERVDEPPLAAQVGFPDDTMRPDRPKQWRNAPDTPNVLNIYPAPDNQNTYQPIPQSPICSTTFSGALATRTYYVKVTYVDSRGNESAASGTNAATSTEIFIPANYLLVVNPPIEPLLTGSSGVKYDRWNVYASTTLGSEQKQNASPLAVSAKFTEPGTGLISGAPFPTHNNVEPIDGYVIEFRYFKQRQQLVNAGQILQIPDIYKQIVIAGVNWLAFHYLHEPSEAKIWEMIFKEGVVQMIRDRNLGPRGAEFIRPDGASLGNKLPSIETLDPTLLRSQ